jgi:transcriptional activator
LSDTAAIGSGKRNLLPELAAYLKLNPGSTAEEVSRAMGGPRGPWAASTRASNMSRLRAWMGQDPDGRNYVPALGEGELYTLTPGVGCDWEIFRHLARRGLQRCSQGATDSGITDLQAAMRLVRGQPFSGGAGLYSYVWAEFLRQEMISAIVEVAHTLAVRLMEAGDPAAARVAATQGLSVEPGSELLYRALFTAEHQAGNAAGIEEAAGRLMVTLAELDLDMAPKTADLLNELRNRRHGSG